MLKLKPLPERLPLDAESFLKMLNAIVPRDSVRPGQNMDEVFFQAGARALVDVLLARWETDKDESRRDEELPEPWYAQDPELQAYVDGDW